MVGEACLGRGGLQAARGALRPPRGEARTAGAKAPCAGGSRPGVLSEVPGVPWRAGSGPGAEAGGAERPAAHQGVPPTVTEPASPPSAWEAPP